MLKISKEQMQSYRDERIEDSIVRLIAALRRHVPPATSDSELRAFCNRGLDAAAVFGIGTEYNVYRFLCCMLIYGENFHSDPRLPWTREILDDRAMNQDHKARLLEMRIAVDTGRGI
jgi:hypothetical protein